MTADNTTKEIWSNYKHIDEIIEVDELKIIGDSNKSKFKKSLTYLNMIFKLFIKLKKHNFDTCFILYPNLFIMPLIPFILRIKETIGFTYRGGIFSFLLTKKVESKGFFEGYHERHIVEPLLDLLRVANLKFESKEVVSAIDIEKKHLSNIKSKLKNRGIKPHRICLHTTSKMVVRNWPRDRYRKLLIEITKKYSVQVLLLGSPSEKAYNDIIGNGIKNVHNLCGLFSLSEIGAILKISDLFIGNDSGLAHYSSAVGTNTVVIFGSSNPRQARPIGIGKTVTIMKNKKEGEYYYARKELRNNLKLMKSVKVKDVVNTIKPFLEKFTKD